MRQAKLSRRHLLTLMMPLGLSVALGGYQGVALAQTQLREHEIKAVFVFNLIKLAEWPPEMFINETAPFVIGFFGKNPFGDSATGLGGKKVRERGILVKEFQSIEEARKETHLLFISPSEKNRLNETLEGLKGSNVLTISDMEGFVANGGMVGLSVEKNRFVFTVNARALAEAKIVLPSQVLKLAREIKK